MKAKDLYIPFSWEERRPCIQDGIFFVPPYYSSYSQFSFPGWDHPSLFPKAQPIMLEYCSGNGAWLVEKAKHYPHFNWVGVERQFDRVRKIWAYAKRSLLTNLFIVYGEAMTFSSHYAPSGSVEEVFINFPDPWPKKRHHKHRLIQEGFLKESCRILKDQGKFTFVTDDLDYREWTLRHLSHSPFFTPLYPPPFYRSDIFDYGESFFDALWREKGRSIFYLHYQKT